MTAQDIEYVELYASDMLATVDYFVSSFGFTLMAESTGDGNRSSLLRHGTVQLVVTAGRGTEAFIEAHGDGIADIAFGCDDPARTCERALAAGAALISSAPGKLVVSGLGDLSHTLVDRSAGASLPADRAWQPVAEVSARPGRIWLLDHVALLVEGGALEGYADFCTEAFGLARYSGEYIELGEQAIDSIVVRSPSGGITFTILEQDQKRKPGQLEGFISRYGGPGVQHLAFLVDDIVSAVQEFRARGVEFLRNPDTYYDTLAHRLPGIKEEIAGLRATGGLRLQGHIQGGSGRGGHGDDPARRADAARGPAERHDRRPGQLEHHRAGVPADPGVGDQGQHGVDRRQGRLRHRQGHLRARRRERLRRGGDQVVITC